VASSLLNPTPQSNGNEVVINTLKNRASTFAALALDLHTQRKITRRGVYAIPEDDKDAQKLNDLKSMRVRNKGYEAPKEQEAVGPGAWTGDVWRSEHERDGDIGYHNRYGAEDDIQGSGPIDDGKMGYHGKFFTDKK
jgi:hypothetical protein